MADTDIRIRSAEGEADFAAVRALVKAYAGSLGIDLSFQNIDEELATLPGEYAPPAGALLLAEDDRGTALGCVALRPLGGSLCEMKRLYVLPAGRHHGIGTKLVALVIAEAKARGYARMRLDTLPNMEGALTLYRACGFRQIPPYYETPIPGTLFFELAL